MTKQNHNTLLTVFTPAYNRAYSLPRTYESLCCQSCKDFIWLIVDDGSTDHTKELVKEWQEQDNGFEIRYLYKENGGMHTAHNTAYEHIDTELNVCIDSDDMLAEDAVRKILNKWEEVRDRGYAGIIGLDADFDGHVVGNRFPDGMTETTLSGYYAAGGKGDMKLVYRTDIINQYPPYPVFPGEKYFSLSYKYHLIDRDYKMAVLDEVLCTVEYQVDGSTRNMWSQYARNPKGFALWRRIRMQYPVSRKRVYMDCVHYVSSCILAGNKHFIMESPKKGMTVLAIAPGVMLALFIKMKTQSIKK